MFEGEDVSDIWKGSKRSRKNPLFWNRFESKRDISMLQANWKMHRSGNGTALYNLSDNPQEDVNLVGIHSEIAAKLEKKLDDWIGSFPNEDGSKAVVITAADIPESIQIE